MQCKLHSKSNGLEVFCLILSHVSHINIANVCTSQVTTFLVAELSAQTLLIYRGYFSTVSHSLHVAISALQIFLTTPSVSAGNTLWVWPEWKQFRTILEQWNAGCQIIRFPGRQCLTADDSRILSAREILLKSPSVKKMKYGVGGIWCEL